MTGYSDVRKVLEEYFKDFPEVMLFDAGQFDITEMGREGISGRALDGDNVFCLVVMAKALSARSPFAEPEWKKTPLYTAVLSGVLGIVAQFAFSDNIAAFAMIGLAFITSSYAVGFTAWKYGILREIRLGRFQSEEYWDAPNPVVRERVMTIFGELSRVLVGGHVNHKHARKLVGSKIDVSKGPSEVVLVGEESEEAKEILGDNYAVFDKGKNVLYVLGTLARAPDWVLATILTHEVAHHFTKREFRANLFAAYNFRKALRAVRDLSYTKEDYRIATVTKNRETREQSLRKSRLAVLIAERMKKEGYAITDEDIELLKKVFLAHAAGGSDGEYSLEVLDEEGVILPEAGRELIRYYHSFAAFNNHLKYAIARNPDSVETLLDVKRLLPIVRLVDQFEEDQDRMGMMVTSVTPETTFHHTFKILQDVFDEEGIVDRSAFSVFRSMMGEADPRVLNLIAEARRTNILTVSDHVLMEISTVKEKKFALSKGLHRDPGKDEHAVMMFTMALPEKLKKRVVHYLEENGFDVARGTRKRGRIGMDNVLRFWGTGGVIEDSVNELSKEGFGVFLAKVAIVQNDGKAFEEWFQRIEDKDPKHPAVKKLRYWINTLNRGVETVIVRSRVSKRKLMEQFNAPESALDVPFQDFFSGYVVGHENMFRAELGTLRREFIEPELQAKGQLKKVFKAGGKALLLTDVGLANGINCPSYEKLQNNTGGYTELKWKKTKKTSPAAISSLKEMLFPGMPLKSYSLKVAPWIEEGLFYLIPFVTGFITFGIESIWTVIIVAATRAAFFFLHKKPRDLMSMTQEEIFELFNPSYGQLRKHVYADLKYVVALAKAMGIEEGSEDMHMLRVIALTHDLGGVLGLKNDEEIEKNLMMLAMDKKVQYEGRDQNDVEADLIGRQAFLTADDKNFIPVMDHPNNSLRILDSYGINVPPMVRKIISRHMSSPTEKEFKSWTERERRLFTCFTIADVFETGNNYYKQKGGYYKHESKFEEPEKTIDFIKSTKFRDRPSIEGYVSAAEEFIFAGGIDEAIKFSRTPIDKADMSMEIIPRAPPKKRIIPAVVAIAGALLPVMPLVSPGFQSVPAVFILISALVIASTHFILNILAFILEWIPASIVEEGKEGEGESSDAAAPVFVTEAASMLASEDEAVRVDAIKRLGNSGSPYAIAPLVKFLGTLNQSGASDDPRVKIAVIEQLARLKKVSLKVRGSREAGSSIMGIINSSLDELSIPRESVNIYGPYERMKIKFDLPVSPTGKIARLNSVLREKFVASHIAVNITRPERNALELSFDLTVENLTAFWRALGTVDLKVDEENNYRKFTDVEMMKKIEERTRMLLGGMEEGSDEYRALHFFVYGDGTNANPGLLNIMSHPEKIRTISEEEYEQRYEAGRRESQLVKMVDDRRVVTYGDAQLLRVESVTTRKHNPDYCSYNDLFTMSMSNPYFSHYLENVSGEEFGDVGGIKRWVYLARAAGSVFQTSYMTDIMRGKESNDYMFFISQDTIAPYNRYGSTLDMLVSDTDRADDMDFEGLKAYILSDLNKKYTEGKERWREVLDAIWLQLENSFILEGVKPGEHIMAVDEIANGTYDFMLKYIVEKKTLERTLEEKGTTLEAETKNIIDEEGLEAEAAEKEARRRNQVNVEIFIGKARTAIIEGYPELQIKRIMEDFGISRERADEIIESVSTVADFIPHPIKIGLDENTQPPFLGGDLPIQLEESDVLIASYLKALITINGLIDYHEKVVFYPLANLLVNDRNPEVRKAAASALAELGLSAKAKEVLVKVAADEIDSSVRSEISAALIKILTGELNDAIEVDEAGEVKVRSMKKLLEKINLVIEATDYPYAKTREFASSILAAVSGDMSAGVDRKMNALPVDSAQMAKAAREHSFVVPSVNIGLGKVTLLFQAQAVLEAARDKHAAVGIALSHDEFENFDYRNEPSPVDRVADIAEKVYNGEESMYFYHLESPKITEYTPAEMNRVKRIITMAMEQGYTSVSTDCSRLYIEGRILSEEKDWDDQYKEIGVFRNISIRKEGNDIIEEFEVMGKGKSIAGDYEPVGKMVLRNGKIIQVPKLWQEGYFNYTPENIMIDKTMSIEERLRDVIKASADIYEHIQQECRRLGIKVGREATIGEVDSGLSILDSATGQTVKALTTPEEVSVFLNGVTSRINARLRGKQEIHKPYDLVAINNGLLHGYRFDENDRLIAQSANSIDLKLTSSVASSLQTAITQHGFSGTDYRSGKDIPKSGISKININTDLQAIVWKVLETYEPGTFRKVFDKARERAVSLGEEYVTDDAEYDYAHAKNRIIYGHAKKVIVSAGKENDYTLINEIKNAIQNSNKRMIIDGDAPGRISASYVVHDIQFTEDNEKGNSAVWMIRDLTRRKMTEVLEELGCTGSADKIPRRGQRRLLGSQIADLLHRESVFSMIGTTDFVQGTKDVVRKLAEAYEENIDADRPTVGVLLGAVSSGKRTMAKSIRRNMRGYESKTGKKCNVRYFWSESGWMFGYSRREDPSIFGRFDLKGSLGFRSFMRRIREGKDAYVPFFDQGKRRRFRVADPSPYASSNGDVDEERFTQVVRDRIERLKTAGAEEVMVREAVLLRLFNENGEWLVRDSRLQEEIEEGFRLIEEHGNWERDIVRKNLYIDITERKNGQFVSGDIVERIMPSGNDIFIVSSRIVGSDEVFLPEEREELFDVSVGMWAPPEVRKLKLLRRLRSEVLYSLTPENVTLASFDMKLTTEEMKWIDPTLRGADMVLLNINNFEKFLFSEKVQETFTEQLIAGMYVMLSERYNVLDGQELFASEKSKLEKIIFSYGRVIDGELMTDDRLLARMKKEILEPGVPDKRLITEHMMTIGIPAGMFGELSENDIRTLESIHDARVVILESLTKEGMLDELEQARRRYRCASSVLVDADAGTEHLARLIVKFAEEMKDRVFVLAHPEVEEFSPETISKIDNLPFLLEEISSKYLDVLGSLELGSMSVYQMRVENSYRTVEGNFRVDYKPAAINEKDDHYLLHYAEGEKILDAAHGAIVPAGLEIARRRERMKVTIDTDRQRDRFMVMAPENVVTETEKAEFKERLIELWMLDGLVKGEDIVILDWKEEGYTNSDLFGMTQSVASEANVQNTGIRVISGDLGYSNKALLQVNLSSKAANNLNQYEVFVNLLLTGKPGRLTGLAKLDLTEGRLFIYLPKARPIDFENEVRNYYEKYREVLIRA
ncbi:MAG: class II fructose-bisphosphate aldolase [Candidatus Omnitrophota bacterium]